ncbi:hypothetical protein LA303_10015 [Candidatus Sulfidibacterium hydrothermale]|uniref:hypothetical protein n=1 Tax=Candidatus Sulfidibacterium hydrothermale TaxID=2875962 RepID=UPI001F0A5432|nr:hypothetical protein [Candidatus Sulfidibacterium hydrothermale]UBM61738.1 hypothetical protein LA303_10015 [Candidatus Sulfidibacterium hydrothermale]
MNVTDFDSIRPYNEEEAKEAFQRIVRQHEFRTIVAFAFGEDKIDEMIARVAATKSINEFQRNFMRPLVQELVKKTTRGLTVSGFHSLRPDDPHLFIGNHRDITLDSSILATILTDYDIFLAITWGDNLMVSPFVTDLGKVNRMVTVFREGTPREILLNSQRLSAYLRKTILEDKLYVWIAQRKGRAKNGDDRTDPGVLKMLSLSGKGDLVEKLKPLNIRPVCVSYEWEPCDIQKVKELYISSRQTYVKSKDEDLQSIIGGIMGQKGRVHYAVGNSLNAAMDKLPEDLPNNERLQRITSLIDIEMFNSYRLWPNNFLALDLLNNSREFQNHYDAKTEKAFEEKTAVMLEKLQSVKGNPEELIQLFRTLYAKPLQNKLENNLSPDSPQ